MRLGQELLDLHIGFEDAEPFALQRVDKDGAAGKATLKADKGKGTIVLDGQTTLNRVPAAAWEYRLGSRSALEWVLDQYKEKNSPRPHHPGALQHLPLRQPQGAGRGPAAARLHG